MLCDGLNRIGWEIEKPKGTMFVWAPIPEPYRDMASREQQVGAHAWLARATAGVYNQCIVFALTGRPQDVKSAVQTLIVPVLSDAVELATGRMRAVQIRA